jgi:hypothetical protein
VKDRFQFDNGSNLNYYETLDSVELTINYYGSDSIKFKGRTHLCSTFFTDLIDYIILGGGAEFDRVITSKAEQIDCGVGSSAIPLLIYAPIAYFKLAPKKDAEGSSVGGTNVFYYGMMLFEDANLRTGIIE